MCIYLKNIDLISKKIEFFLGDNYNFLKWVFIIIYKFLNA